MGVQTTYDDMRYQLKLDLNNCLKDAMKMLDDGIWGYDSMREGYIINVISAITNARDTI